jgi:hypothetical protein
MSYQSPIQLQKNECNAEYSLSVLGENRGSVFLEKSLIFIVQDDIFLTHHKKTYRLHEYHFHIPSEHVTNKKYEAEVHYVFTSRMTPNVIPYNICNGHCMKDEIIVMGVFIQPIVSTLVSSPSPDMFPVHVPERYFEYDGTLDSNVPVRWIIGKYPIHYDINLIPLAKQARSLQSLDHRLVLYANKTLENV